MNEKMGFKGTYEIISEDITTGEKSVLVVKNVVTQLFYDAVHKFLDHSISSQSADVLNITHLAVGDGSTPAGRSQEALVNETFRKSYSVRAYTDTVFRITLSIDASEGNPPGGVISEVGIFCKGTLAAESGTMISRTVVNVLKNSNIKLLINWYLRSA